MLLFSVNCEPVPSHGLKGIMLLQGQTSRGILVLDICHLSRWLLRRAVVYICFLRYVSSGQLLLPTQIPPSAFLNFLYFLFQVYAQLTLYKCGSRDPVVLRRLAKLTVVGWNLKLLLCTFDGTSLWQSSRNGFVSAVGNGFFFWR